jgi:hypothetical protein
MAITIDELAIVVDSSLQICITDEDTNTVSLQITGAQIRVGAGPELQDIVGTGVGETAGVDEARVDYASKIAGKVMVVGGNPRGLEVHVPNTIIGGA